MKNELMALPARIWRRSHDWIQQQATLHQLLELDDRMLKDLGLSRAQARFELDSHGSRQTARPDIRTFW